MKINRQKRAKRIVGFYKSRFSFREPYQVLVDGTFCKAALQSKVNIRDQIPPYLDGDVKLLTTQCAIHETELLGPALYGVMVVIKQFPIHKCGHEKNNLSASKCFQSMIGENNSSHYIVATQDNNLKENLRSIPGTPIIYLHFNAPVLENPSEYSEEIADIRNVERLHPSDYQKTIIEDMKNEAGIVVPEIRKRKKKKGGPNPLSCKKKKVITKPTPTNVNKRSRKHIRVKIAKHIKDDLASKTT